MADTKHNNKLVIGITGGICSGKSAFSSEIVALGGTVIDADIVARAVIRDRAIIASIVDAFGICVLDKASNIDRAKLRAIILDDSAKRATLNNIMWHTIIDCIKTEINTTKTNIIFVDAALLIESGMLDIVDKLVVIVAPMDRRIEWLQSRDSISRIDAIKAINAQMTDDDRIKHATIVVYNSSDLESVYREAKKVYQSFVDSTDYTM